jgi:hypothetical protein
MPNFEMDVITTHQPKAVKFETARRRFGIERRTSATHLSRRFCREEKVRKKRELWDWLKVELKKGVGGNPNWKPSFERRIPS